MLSSVHNVVSVLRAFRLDRPEMSLAELARAVELPKPTVNKVVQTLLAEGFLERVSDRARYRPNLRMFELGHFILNHLDMVHEATPYIRHLSQLTGETAHLTAYENGEVIWLLRIDGPSSSELYSRIGRRAPATAAAAGRAILAFLAADELDHVISQGWRKLTVKTTADRDQLLRDLALVRQNGYSFQTEEVDIGIASVGAPVFDYQQRPVASVSVAGPSVRFTTDAVRRIGLLAQQTALAISRRMGYQAVHRARQLGPGAGAGTNSAAGHEPAARRGPGL